jgi:hypothetical protein
MSTIVLDFQGRYNKEKIEVEVTDEIKLELQNVLEKLYNFEIKVEQIPKELLYRYSEEEAIQRYSEYVVYPLLNTLCAILSDRDVLVCESVIGDMIYILENYCNMSIIQTKKYDEIQIAGMNISKVFNKKGLKEIIEVKESNDTNTQEEFGY